MLQNKNWVVGPIDRQLYASPMDGLGFFLYKHTSKDCKWMKDLSKSVEILLNDLSSDLLGAPYFLIL